MYKTHNEIKSNGLLFVRWTADHALQWGWNSRQHQDSCTLNSMVQLRDWRSILRNVRRYVLITYLLYPTRNTFINITKLSLILFHFKHFFIWYYHFDPFIKTITVVIPIYFRKFELLKLTERFWKVLKMIFSWRQQLVCNLDEQIYVIPIKTSNFNIIIRTSNFVTNYWDAQEFNWKFLYGMNAIHSKQSLSAAANLHLEYWEEHIDFIFDTYWIGIILEFKMHEWKVCGSIQQKMMNYKKTRTFIYGPSIWR